MAVYQITKPLSELPPLRAKPIKIRVDPTSIDFVRQFNAICVNLHIHNHTGNTGLYTINDENDQVTVKTNDEELTNVHVEKFSISGINDGDLICVLAPIPLLKKHNAIEVG